MNVPHFIVLLWLFVSGTFCLAEGETETLIIQFLRDIETPYKSQYALKIKSLGAMLKEVDSGTILNVLRRAVTQDLSEGQQATLAGCMIEQFAARDEKDSITIVLSSLPTGAVSFVSTEEFLTSRYALDGIQFFFAAYQKARSADVKASIAWHLRAAFHGFVTNVDQDDVYIASAAEWFAANKSKLVVGRYADRGLGEQPRALVKFKQGSSEK